MIEVTIFKLKMYKGFRLSDMQLCRKYGSDIVCAAVSALLSTVLINRRITEDDFSLKKSEDSELSLNLIIKSVLMQSLLWTLSPRFKPF